MCGLAGIYHLAAHKPEGLQSKLDLMNQIQAHRGPDDLGTWISPDQSAGLAHRRLSIIDISKDGHQPMVASNGNVLVFNGAIYNYKDLRNLLGSKWTFKSHSDTETILAAYDAFGDACVEKLRGMFAFAIWDDQKLFCARDRFGIKPFYYAIVNNTFYFASEVKALLPFLPSVETEQDAFSEYIAFQCPITEKTLFKGVYQLMPGHALKIENGKLKIWRYWGLDFNIDQSLTTDSVLQTLDELMEDSIKAHLESDVPVGAYVSGGMDSSLVAYLAHKRLGRPLPLFHGKFTDFPGYDESRYAQDVADLLESPLHVGDFKATDFEKTIRDLMYHMDYPVAGPGAFPQFMVSGLASEHVKVVLGGQGGDEIFGGYARYLITYFEQALRAAIDGESPNDNIPISAESLVGHLSVIKDYKGLLGQVWSKGLFGPLAERYFGIINRSLDFADELVPGVLNLDEQLQKFASLFDNNSAFHGASYFDRMLRFDFSYLMPGLLHVEDRVSMAHALEARVPLLDHPLVEFMATVPSTVKFRDGQMKGLMRQLCAQTLPSSITTRKDKMGFPVPLHEWMKGELRDFIFDTLHTGAAKDRDFIDYKKVIKHTEATGRYSRKLWAFLSYELWSEAFCDKKAVENTGIKYSLTN